ncbi:hypothetical protein CASFOL_033240 [Castilleja foliolosa]|uniref:RING-type domain-containing protein n=1 Tax=Castilleja foliolosa TaxID=1961234 RepID=A0ABD3BZK3_9LAMI
MAVAGLHNVSPFVPPFFGDSQVSRPSTGASSLFQMWRELEGDRLVSPSHTPRRQLNPSNTSDDMSYSNQGVTCSETEHDDNNSIISEQSTELGENEWERVRHIFRGWRDSVPTGHSSDELSSKNRSGSQWLGENECERVRIVRDWVQMNDAQQRTNRGESGSQIEQVCDGLAVSHPEIGARRPFRRICGRQTLVDLIVRAQWDRKRELECLLERRPVSEFAQRNRIQTMEGLQLMALLRGRFLRIERSIPDKRPSSVAATELVLLRERHTVSGLREGFLSKLDNSASVNSSKSDSSSNDENNGELENTTDMEREVTDIQTASNFVSAEHGSMSQQELVLHVTEIEINVQEVSLDMVSDQQQVSTDVEHEINTTITDEMPLEHEDINYNGSLEVSSELYESRSDVSFDQELAPDLQGNNNGEQFEWLGDEESPWQERLANQLVPNLQDQMQESREDDLQEAIDSWRDVPAGEVGVSNGTSRAFNFPDDDNAQNMEIREIFSRMTRRRVSSLLQSVFRESLDQVLQSHVERLGNHASVDRESDDVSLSPGLVEQETGQHNDDGLAWSPSEVVDWNLFAPTSTLAIEPQPLDFESQITEMLHNGSNQQLGTEWEVVNEFRTDMARFQQRLNNMQSMLEQCMDMQIELQRSVRQEVSAALNRSILTRDESKENHTLHDESQLDYVRKGICCVCHDSKIDSLLYRCGHLCTCSKCAERLVQGPGKCPMCRAPVVESIRAYFIQ